MWRVLLLLAGCSFAPGSAPGRDDGGPVDEDATLPTCATPAWPLPYAYRFPIDTGGAPASYTLRVDASAALALARAGTDDIRVFAGDTEIDRLVSGTTVELKAPVSGPVWLYAGDAAATAPPANPNAVYLFAESFEALPVGDHGSARFVPLPETDWNVIDDAGNHVYRATGASRHPAAIRDLLVTDGDIRARMRINTGGGQQHDGLAARGNSMVPLTMDGFVGQLMGDSNRQRIAEYINGASPPLERAGVDQAIARDTWFALRLRYVGDTIELFVDGALVLTATQGGSDGQLVGLFAHDCTADYDDVTVRMAATPEPIASLGAREDRCP